MASTSPARSPSPAACSPSATACPPLLPSRAPATATSSAHWPRPRCCSRPSSSIESRTAEPLVSLRILRRPTVLSGNLGGLTALSMTTAVVVFVGTLYLQQVNALSPV
ncbi:hypothetical protein [Streptacidiphilus monticola]|uniref:Uncharacterized protein n=1 Tax=Streptacidiphilus monticola TaxID=2161674 RepID=A0ABW1GAV7_9ACTN